MFQVRANLTLGFSTPVDGSTSGSSSSSRRRGLAALSPADLAMAWTGSGQRTGPEDYGEGAGAVQLTDTAPPQGLVWVPAAAHGHTAEPQQRLFRARQDLGLATRLLQAGAGEPAHDGDSTGHDGADEGGQEEGVDPRVRRLLQSMSAVNCTAPAALSAASSSNASAAAGLASFSSLSTSCSTPSINAVDVALGVLTGAINDLLNMDAAVSAVQSSMGTAADGIDTAEARLAEVGTH